MSRDVGRDMGRDPSEYAVDFFADPHDFLRAAGDHLAARAVESTVVLTSVHRHAQELAEGVPRQAAPHEWYAVIRDRSGAVVSAAMRTAPFAPHPAYVLAMPDDAGRALARAVHARGELLDAANGGLLAVEAVMAETARRAGGTVRATEETRLWELGELREPTGVPGTLRPARPDEASVALPFYRSFGTEAAEMAGRPDAHPTLDMDLEMVARRIAEGTVWFWEVDGEVVHLTQGGPAAFGVARIGPVLTPKRHRGRGYASAAVAGVARELRDTGVRVCLFTDRANPTSNRIYAALGFEPVLEGASLVLDL